MHNDGTLLNRNVWNGRSWMEDKRVDFILRCCNLSLASYDLFFSLSAARKLSNLSLMTGNSKRWDDMPSLVSLWRVPWTHRRRAISGWRIKNGTLMLLGLYVARIGRAIGQFWKRSASITAVNGGHVTHVEHYIYVFNCSTWPRTLHSNHRRQSFPKLFDCVI